MHTAMFELRALFNFCIKPLYIVNQSFLSSIRPTRHFQLCIIKG